MNDLATEVDRTNLATGNLPAPNVAVMSIEQHNSNMLDQLRAEQAQCDDMLNYWQIRSASVARSIEAILASTAALNRIPSRLDTSVVTKPRKPKPQQEKPANG